MAISKTLTVNIKEDKAKANEKMFIYRNDKGIDMYISLSNLSYLFDGGANYSYVSAIFKSPSEEVHIKNGLPIVDGRIKFTFDSEIIRNMQEIGTYELQFQLFDKNSNRLTIPSYFFEVKEPIANASVEYFDGIVDLALADYSYVEEEETSLFAIVDGYIRTDWKAGDLITSKRLNNLEEGVSLALDSLESVKDIDVVYKSNEPSTVQVGGIPIGYVTGDDGISVLDFIDAMLHPYQAPTISLSATPNTTLYEIGHSISDLSITAKGTKKSNDLTEIAILKNGSIVKNNNFNPPISSNATLYHTESNVKSDINFSAYVYDGKTKVNSNTFSINFINPIYIGYVDNGNPNENEIKSMTKRIVKPSNQSYNYTVTNKRLCIAVPSNWDIKSIIDPNNFDITSSFNKISIGINCLDYTIRTYKVYVSEPTSQSNFTVKFNI